MTPSIEQMTETLLKVNFQGGESNRTNEKGAVNATGDSSEWGMGQEDCNRKEATNTPISISQKKSMWQRLKRALEEEQRDSNIRISTAEKRDASEAELIVMGITKKLKQGDDSRGEIALSQVVAAQQPRRAP